MQMSAVKVTCIIGKRKQCVGHVAHMWVILKGAICLAFVKEGLHHTSVVSVGGVKMASHETNEQQFFNLLVRLNIIHSIN